MKKKYILALTFLCLLIGQSSFGQIQGNGGDCIDCDVPVFSPIEPLDIPPVEPEDVLPVSNLNPADVVPSDTPDPTADVNIPSTASSGDTSSGDTSSGDTSSWGISSWGGGYSSQPTYYPDDDSSNDGASSDNSGNSIETSINIPIPTTSNYTNDITSPVVEAVIVSLPSVDAEYFESTLYSTSNTFEEGKNNVFNANGRPLESGSSGDLLQIKIDGVLRKPSELLRTQGTLEAFVRISTFYAKSKGYVGIVKLVNNTGKDGGNDVAWYGNGVLTVRAIAFSAGKFNNVNDFKSIINHEVLHYKDPRNDATDYNFMDHANIYLGEAKDPEFNKTSKSYKINNANQYMIRVLNGVGMNNTNILAAIKKYNDDNKGGVLISNAFYSGSLTGFSFTTSIDGTIYENYFSYKILQSPRD